MGFQKFLILKVGSNFSQMKKMIFPWLVKEFYTNLFFSQNSRILKSFVQGKEITLDDSTLGKILNIPHKGWGLQDLSEIPQT